jgi:hypothetical protein
MTQKSLDKIGGMISAGGKGWITEEKWASRWDWFVSRGGTGHLCISASLSKKMII